MSKEDVSRVEGAALVKAALQAPRPLFKGDLPGHEFRGNQYTGGGSEGGDPSFVSEYGKLQDSTKSLTSKAREDGAQTYTSSSTSPNMGMRTFVDVSHSDPVKEREISAKIQDHFSGEAAKLRDAGYQTYVSSSTSPNMGTRTFIDVAKKK